MTHFSMDQLHAFVVAAKRATYVGNGQKLLPYRLGSHDLQYFEGDWAYHDTYLGENDFIGQEAVYLRSQAVWAINYFGRILAPEFITSAEAGQMIKVSLAKMYAEGRFLGGFEHCEGDLTYVDTNDGAALLSQFLIFTAWQDARVGSIANLIILVVALLHQGSVRFEGRYRQDARNGQERVRGRPAATLREADLQTLPQPVQRYLRYVGVVGKPKVVSMFAEMTGEMRQKDRGYFPLTAEQHNFFDQPTRLFFMLGRMVGLTVPGYHRYQVRQGYQYSLCRCRHSPSTARYFRLPKARV